MNDIGEEFDFQVEDRVHVMPIGYEKERAYKAADALKADRVILIGHEGDDEKGEHYVDDVYKYLREIGVEVDREECNIFNLYDALGIIAERIDDCADEDVYVNVATGGKITAIAGMIACMVTGATPYYVQAEDYESTPPKGIAEITQLPRYPIDAPKAEQIEILNFIKTSEESGSPATKGELIEFGERVGLPFIADHQVEDKSKYRILTNQIIEPLEDDNYIQVRKSGREKVVEMTLEGEKTLHAFRYLIENGYDEP